MTLKDKVMDEIRGMGINLEISHVERLISLISYWSSHYANIQTSIRVNEAHSQMVAQGIYRGGTVPFGYKLVPSGKFNRRGKELLKVIVDMKNEGAVRYIFDYVCHGFSNSEIAEFLNGHNCKTAMGNNWTADRVRSVIRNPMYKGYMTYARGKENEVRSAKANPDIIIVSKKQWSRAQALQRGRGGKKVK